LQPRRIALIKPSALGDIVHSLPVLHALRVRFPDAHLTWVVNRSFESLLRGHPETDAIIPFDRRAGLRNAPAFARILMHARFDLVVDLQGLLRTGLMTAATRASRRIGLSSAREGAAWFYTDVIRVPSVESMHAVDRYWLVAEAIGAGGLPKVFRLPADPEADTWASNALQSLPRPWFVVSPGSRWTTKRWPVDHFSSLLRRALHSSGGSIVLIGSSDESVLTQSIASLFQPAVLDLAGKTSLPQLTALLRKADVVLANDSGPLHLAAALGRPVVAPYTCTTIARHGPYGQSGATETKVWCRGSYRKRCDRLECMSELTPERLWPKLDEVLTRWQSRCRSA
jgi:lipopolysaccharide heptosyltransferase I